jgi:hypothetical protein
MAWAPRGADSLEAAVAQALGSGSMCWDPPPEGVFDPERATEICDGLCAWIRERAYEIGRGVL